MVKYITNINNNIISVDLNGTLSAPILKSGVIEHPTGGTGDSGDYIVADGNGGWSWRPIQTQNVGALNDLTDAITDTTSIYLGSNSGLNSTGSYNIALGIESSFSNQTGTHNISIGYQSLYSNQTGSYNVCVGNYAGNQIKSDKNVMVGTYAGRYTTTGINNAFVGYNAGQENTSGSQNTAVGTDALRGTGTGYNINTATINNCVGIGTNAGQGTHTNSDCVYIGCNAAPQANNTVNEVVIGANTTGNGSNTITLGTSSHETVIPGTLNAYGQVVMGSTRSQNEKHNTVYYTSKPGAGASLNILTLLTDTTTNTWRSATITIKEAHSPDNGEDKGGGLWVGGFSYNFDNKGNRQVDSFYFSRVSGTGGGITFGFQPINTSNQPGGVILQISNFRTVTNNVEMEITWHSLDTFNIS